MTYRYSVLMMLPHIQLDRLMSALRHVDAEADDSEDARLQKTLLVGASLLPGKIQITRGTYELLKDACICVPRGKVLIKGKGEMETWFLEGIKANHE